MNYTVHNERIRYSLLALSGLGYVAIWLVLGNIISGLINDGFWARLIFSVVALVLSYLTLFYVCSYLFFRAPIWKLLADKLIPDFNGEWKGKGKSARGGESFDVRLVITQTLTKISINAYFDESQSEAFNCHIERKKGKEKLYYNYYNEPRAATELDKHYGTIVLTKEGNVLNGNYFTDRKPQTRGELVDLKRQP